MRRMITTKKEQQLLDMTESVFESGVWVIPSGTTGGVGDGIPKTLKDLEVGYQYKIYLNVKGTISSIIRHETEIGVTSSYIAFVDTKIVEFFASGSTDGGNSFRLYIAKRNDSSLRNEIRFSGTTTAEISLRYLITRSKLYF